MKVHYLPVEHKKPAYLWRIGS